MCDRANQRSMTCSTISWQKFKKSPGGSEQTRQGGLARAGAAVTYI
jgi:hypothetical protein